MDLKRRILVVLSVCLVSLLITANVFCQLPWHKASYFKNFGGLNDNISSIEIADNEASDIQNIIFDTGGALTKRKGYRTIPIQPVSKSSTGTNVSVTGLSWYTKKNNDRYLVALQNKDSSLWATYKQFATGSGIALTGSWVNIEFTSFPTSHNDSYLVDFATAEDWLVMTTPSSTGSTPYRWNATGTVIALTGDTDVPEATICEYHKNHLFLAGNTDNPSRVYFSGLDDITDFTATDYFDIETNDGSEIRGLFSAYNALYIFKDNSIWRLGGYERDTFTLEKMVDGVGTKSQQSIKSVRGSIYFTTKDNDIVRYTGGYSIEYISTKISNTIDSFNYSRAPYSTGLSFENNYYVAMSTAGSGTNDRVLLFDTSFDAWSKFKGMDPSAWCVGEDSTDKPLMLFGDADGYVHYYPADVYYDGDVATPSINAYYQTKWFRYSDLSLGDKYWRTLKTYALTEDEGGTLYADCKSDYEATGTVLTIDLQSQGSLWDVMVWDVDLWGGQTLTIDRQEIEKGTDMFQIKYYNTATEGFTILGFTTTIEPTERD